jgi:positive regulator of sigma E activity
LKNTHKNDIKPEICSTVIKIFQVYYIRLILDHALSIVPILQNRIYLLCIIGCFTAIATISPFFVGQVVTVELIEHEVVHIVSITFGTFLVIIACHSYKISKNQRMIWTILAFLTFTLLSIYLLTEDLGHDRVHERSSLTTDVVLTIMIGFFAVAVFWNNSYKQDKNHLR